MPVQSLARALTVHRGRNSVPWFETAVCLMLAVFSMITRPPTYEVRPDVALAQAELIAVNQGLVQAGWSRGPMSGKRVTGEIVWRVLQQQSCK